MRKLMLGGLAMCALAACTFNTNKDDGKTNDDTDATAGKSGANAGSSGTAASGGSGVPGTGGSSGTSGKPSQSDDGGAGSGSDEPAGAFTASNLPPTAKLGGAGDLVLAGECVIDGKLGTITCRAGEPPQGYDYELLKQSDPDSTNMAVFSVRSLTIESGSNVSIVGPYAVGFVASGDIHINGGLIATVNSEHANGGGFDGVGDGPGLGPGAGSPQTSGVQSGPGGGAFCGRGGPGGGIDAASSNGGTPYGDKALIPLIGGSSGGAPSFGISGAGGGAIQLVAGVSLNIGATGSVAAPGGGGGGVVGSGGGSGGGVLLEAPSVRVAGSVAVNGGGGGAYDSPGQRGRVDGKPAQGGGGVNPGGEGSSTVNADGAAGQVLKSGSSGGGGGGGAGYIRINTADGKADISGTLSPSLDSGCSSVGKLAAK